MRILLVDKYRISKYDIQNFDEAYVINYKPYDKNENVLITFDFSNGKKVIKSNGTVNIINEKMIIPEVALVEYGIYVLKILGSQDYIYIYAYPDFETNIYKLDLANIEEIKIGNSQDCNIIHKNTATGNLHAIIRKINGKWRIESADNYKVYVNKKSINHAFLKAGDIIFINGIKIVFMTKFLTINNPRNSVSVNGLVIYNDINNKPNNKYDPVTDEDKIANLYNDDDYFYHTPRLKEVIESEEVSIDAPPAPFVNEDLPFWLSMGSILTMGASTFMMMYNIWYGLSSGTRTILSVLPQIIMCVALIIGALIIPRLARRYQKNKIIKKEKLRHEKYGEYLDKKEKEIAQIIKNQNQILNENSITPQECLDAINNKNKNFWARQVHNDDFLFLRLGTGSLAPSISISYPEEHFTLEPDELLENVFTMVDKYKKNENVPICFSFADNKLSAMVGNSAHKEDYLKSLILQLITLHSPQDLKIIIFTNEFNSKKWDYAKFIPHLFSEDKKTRFFATNEDEMKDISIYIEEEYKHRKALFDGDEHQEDFNENLGYKNFNPYYLIINDDYKLAKKVSIINNILKDERNYGFSLLVVEDSMKYVPKECEIFIQISDKDGCILKKDISPKTQINFKLKYAEDLDMNDIARKIGNIPTMVKEGVSVLPSSLSFLDMYGVSKIEQLNIANRWRTNNPVNSLSATIGVHSSLEEFKLNLHEKAHGPHGLIAGSTGSGKSEFIITYILSMALNYHPYEVQFVLIDYKGGGLAGAFENKETGVRIPHLVGTITNLDVNEMNRTLVSIESELKRRQKVFNKVRDSLSESTIDIYKYQRLYREGVVKEPMAHLFIITDEFAELKAQQPEFMNQLISTARIGRSLGVHLILATQKPTGVVNDQIWSNSKFKVCLKVQDRSDSMGILKRPDAASIKEAGRFYLQVGYDDYFDIGQSGWSGAKYVPSDKIIKKVDENLDFINNTGEIIKSIRDLVSVVEVKNDLGDQLTNIVKYIYNLGLKENLQISNLWLDSIPSEIYVNDLKKKYNYKPQPYFINPVIGEYDVPQEQFQNILNLNLTDSGNTVIWGQPGSGKENLLSTIMWSSIVEHTPDEVNFYVIDCGSESLGIFKNMPHVGEIATVDEDEKIVSILQMISDEMERRKELFVEYAGSYKEYISNSGNKLPLIVTIINNYEIFTENYMKISESIQNFYRDGAKYGMVFILTTIATNSIRTRMLQNFNNQIMLQVPNETDYRTYLSAPRTFTIAKYFGRGAISMNKTAYEFQTALITDKKNINNLVRSAAKQLEQSYTTRARKVPVIPKVVTFNNTKEFLKNDFIPVGYDINTKQPVSFLFERKINIVSGINFDQIQIDFIDAIMRDMKQLNKKVIVLDMAEAYEKNYGILCYNKDFDNSFIKIYNELITKKDEETYCFVLGAGYLKTKITKAQPIVTKLFENLSNINVHFIFFDVYESIRGLQTEMWYQNLEKNYGIWLGEGIANQSCINVNKLSLDDRKLNFEYMAFVVDKNNYNVIKHVVDQEVEDE